ncbi:MAG: shikimate dehydrogenase [Streptosporangiaceae bacterium]
MAATRAAVLGSPIAHSLSPALHTAAYHALGLADWSYEAIECDEARLPGLLASLGPDWAGLSLTMPLKRAVLPLLDHAEPLATAVAAANTVILTDGQRLGFNTDVAGLVAAMRAAGVTSEGNVVVLGAGATACAALAALRETGTSDVTVAVRCRPRAESLLTVAGQLGVAVRLAELGAGLLARRRWDLLISTIPGTAAADVAGLFAAGTVTARAVVDVGYDPWPTALAAAAGAAGSAVISGYEMLLHQAAGQVGLMTGHRAPLEVMRAAGLAELDRRRE